MTKTYKIERLGWHGDGVVTIDSSDAFVPFSLPNETIEGDFENGVCNDAKIIEPVADRIKPACRHFKKCGGCTLQHASDTLLANWKAEIVRETLRLNQIETEFRPIITSPSNSRRRAVFSAKRTKKSAEVGFHKRNSDILINLTECPVMHPQIMGGLDTFREIAKMGCSRKTEIRITATETMNGLDVDVTQAKDLDTAQTETLARLCDQHGFSRISWNSEVIAQLQPPIQEFGSAQVIPPNGAFLQATHEGEAALVSATLETLDGCKRVVDLFCGSGTFTLPIAQFAEVHAVETIPEMLSALETGWRQATGCKTVSMETRDLFRRPLLKDEFKGFDGIVIDPPRAGALEQTKVLAQTDITVISFISCNPATFSRDAKILTEAGYKLDWVQVIDQFRWSSHVELAAQFTRA